MDRPALTVYSDLTAVYRPERVWAEGNALALVVAHFLSGAGAGAWLLGLVLDQRLVLPVLASSRSRWAGRCTLPSWATRGGPGR